MASAGAKAGHFAMLTRTAWSTLIRSKRSSFLSLTTTTNTRMLSQDSGASNLKQNQIFDEKMLEHLVCPLSKKDLRYDKEKNELVCDELGVAYPIVNGIPNLVPQDARMLKNDSADSPKS
ncbi:UPF0434 protein Sde_1297-like [Littorina saxatilis]|uniref:Protein preY, mitochondrial n=1 Tax=Littorina saxatilis TaxID=31220 RepID=A0AAN9GPS7_9CAEN